MKTFILLTGLLLFTVVGQAQELQGISVLSVAEERGFATIQIASEAPFIACGNRYVLHIGDAVFTRSLHPEGDLHLLTIYVPIEELTEVPAGAQALLVYGLYRENTFLQSRLQHGVSGLYAQLGNLK